MGMKKRSKMKSDDRDMSVVSVRLPAKLRIALEARAKQESRSLSNLIAVALGDFVDNSKGKIK